MFMHSWSDESKIRAHLSPEKPDAVRKIFSVAFYDIILV